MVANVRSGYCYADVWLAVAVSVSRVAAAPALVVLNGFFVASEFAFVRIRATSVGLVEVNDALGTDLSGDGYETLGGFVLDQIGRSPEVGDLAETDDFAFEVTAVGGARISTVRVTRLDDAEESADGRN